MHSAPLVMNADQADPARLAHSGHSVSLRFCLIAGLAFFTWLTGATLRPGVNAGESDLLSPFQRERLGLVEAWQRQLAVPAGRQSIVDQRILVHGTRPVTVVEVVKEGATTVATDVNMTDAEGDEQAPSPILELTPPPKPETLLARWIIDPLAVSGLDQAEAERLARNEIRRWKRRGITGVTQIRQAPIVRIYTLCDDGTVECRDAETGELIWITRVGDRDYGYASLSANDDFVAVVNGGQLLKLDAINGDEIESIRMSHISVTDMVQCGHYAVVPGADARISCYPFSGPIPDKFEERVSGTCLERPSVGVDALKLAWATKNGYVYVIDMTGTPNVHFRLNIDGIVTGTIAAAPDRRFFLGADSGQIYGVQATRDGQVIWSRPTGEPIYDAPVFTSERVLFRSEYGNLMCVSAESGLGVWDQTVGNVATVTAVLGDQIFATTLSGALMVVSLDDGSVMARMNGTRIATPFFNRKTDRIYLINDRGTVQCLHAPGADLPSFIDPVMVNFDQLKAADETPAEEPASTQPSKPAGDPFNPDAADPFGAGGGAGVDPFGGDAGNMADPFAPAGGDDPFGGADPFGN
ncbi:MAG: PQQ-binding-like beta-propeller repeat protein [Planctomycetota bacterium]